MDTTPSVLPDRFSSLAAATLLVAAATLALLRARLRRLMLPVAANDNERGAGPGLRLRAV